MKHRHCFTVLLLLCLLPCDVTGLRQPTEVHGLQRQLGHAYRHFFSWMSRTRGAEEDTQREETPPIRHWLRTGERPPESLEEGMSESDAHTQAQRASESDRGADLASNAAPIYVDERERVNVTTNSSVEGGASDGLFGFLQMWGPPGKHAKLNLHKLITTVRDQMDEDDGDDFMEELEGLSQQAQVDRIAEALRDLFDQCTGGGGGDADCSGVQSDLDQCNRDLQKKSEDLQNCQTDLEKCRNDLQAAGSPQDPPSCPQCPDCPPDTADQDYDDPRDPSTNLAEEEKTTWKEAFLKTRDALKELVEEQGQQQSTCADEPIPRNIQDPRGLPPRYEYLGDAKHCWKETVDEDVYDPRYPRDRDKRLAKDEEEKWKEAYDRLKESCDDTVEEQIDDPRDPSNQLATVGQPMKDSLAKAQLEKKICEKEDDASCTGESLWVDAGKTYKQTISKGVQQLLYCGTRYKGYTTKSKGSIVSQLLDAASDSKFAISFALPAVDAPREWNKKNCKTESKTQRDKREWTKYLSLFLALEKLTFDAPDQDKLDEFCSAKYSKALDECGGGGPVKLVEMAYAENEGERWNVDEAKKKVDLYYASLMTPEGKKTTAENNINQEENPFCRAYPTVATTGQESNKACNVAKSRLDNKSWEKRFKTVYEGTKNKK
uniref:Uncharacterized protein n=1 Tax=Chromera velia CCMP2878 TaxID=1169474 RepID=A0A0G4HU03_9ALVE|eukprot:Cvel_8560.t1-p1 / transcript=Cvel_8560.t1 / gene=Cvel_8560 / organism=Chromera_velia_CCMP2878 / gene_product=hypothetical protein / transcript_product=hypothetical protein / location=Cvel_scaffold475:4372-18233(+) / protein_length=659 / sequence_SO=supercontig / SO=protein_coding / is_pseudo=false